MKRIVCLIVCSLLMMGICACASISKEETTKQVLTWQEQYDLGIRCLNEGNYEEAILAFLAVIEIDPKQADAYIGLAEAYAALNDTEKMIAILEQGLSETGGDKISGYLARVKGTPWTALSSSQQTMFCNLRAAVQSFDCTATLALMGSDDFLSLLKSSSMSDTEKQVTGSLNVISEDGEKYTVQLWGNEDELDYWFIIHGEDEYWEAQRWTRPDDQDDNDFQLRIRHMSGSVGYENGSYKMVETSADGVPRWIIEGTAKDGIKVGTETQSEYETGEISLIYRFDENGNLLNYIADPDDPERYMLDPEDVFDPAWGKIQIYPGNYPMGV